ncbi:phospholipase A1-II 1-like [Helianthus annuus]|uniref:phospholipase A1-II 1-like n=1 Tax=Helianthus annuus TaxID=4232 RepID=UPI000B8F09BC|nr:phospholipase A1-II 1-like [Helianthus annuus]
MKVGLLKGQPLNQYKLTKYTYAALAVILPGAFVTSSDQHAWSRRSNWIGFIAVVTDERKKALGRRDILVAWRGTVNPSDMIHDSELKFVSAPIIFWENHKDDPKVHEGWYSIYTTRMTQKYHGSYDSLHSYIGPVTPIKDQYDPLMKVFDLLLFHS